MRIVQAADVESKLDWLELMAALEAGHQLPKARISDRVLQRADQSLLMRSAWIDGLGMAVKIATIFPDNAKQQLPSVQGNVLLYDDASGVPEAMVDFDLVTRFKTVGDSLLAASKLARPNSNRILLVGAGRIAATALSAYRVLWPQASFEIWNHRPESAQRLAAQFAVDGVSTVVTAVTAVTAVTDLAQAVQKADIICAATLSQTPIIEGRWLQAGQHIDLIGAYRADMREADDAVMQRGDLYVDSRDTTIEHIGELLIPIASSVIDQHSVKADFYDLASGDFVRESDEAITVFKNGGGAHLDLMTAKYILSQV